MGLKKRVTRTVFLACFSENAYNRGVESVFRAPAFWCGSLHGGQPYPQESAEVIYGLLRWIDKTGDKVETKYDEKKENQH